MHRGARRAPIFRANQHCLLFLAALGETVERFWSPDRDISESSKTCFAPQGSPEA
jgi:hypothetical protein